MAIPAARKAAALALLLTLIRSAAAPAGDGPARVEELPERYRTWLEEVRILITAEEREAFLEIEQDYQRDAFIRRFWEARDPTPGTPDNAFKDAYYARLAEARERYGTPRDDRFRIYVIHGEPGEIEETDCGLLLWPLEIWRYGYSEAARRSLIIVFTQRGGGGPFKIWRPIEGTAVLMGLGATDSQADFYRTLERNCAEYYQDVLELIQTLRIYQQLDRMGPVYAERAPEVLDPEWLETFRAFSTDAPAAAGALAAEVDFGFPGRHGARVVVEGRVWVAAADAATVTIGDLESASFRLTGEVLRDDELFESFRYRYDFPREEGAEGPLYLVFERHLRPGEYRLVLRVDDLNASRTFRDTFELVVPSPGEEIAATAEVPAPGTGPEAAAVVDLELLAEGTELRSGLSRFTAVSGDERVRKVTFLLDGKPVLTKTRPPYSVELNLGSLPVSYRVRAIAYDGEGAELASDEVVLNAGEHAFAARLVEPRAGGRYRELVRARADVQVPAGARLERVEFFLGERLVATLYQPPWAHRIPLAGDGLAYVRVVAYLADGNSTDDLVVFNSAQYLEAVSVRLVEIYAAVLDGDGRPVLDLGRDDFQVLDAGERQELLRFERLDDLPIFAGLLIDTSASMAESLPEVRRVAQTFFERAVRPRDRACVITFADKPRLATAFTNDLTDLAGGLAGLTAERSTALYDSLMFALYYFKGVRGQKTLVVLSDGQDRRSQATFDEALDFARASGITVYTVGLKLSKQGRVSRGRLTRLAEETGGRAFFAESTGELDGIYETIQRELRSRYLLAYQPLITEPGTFRAVEVRVARPGVEVIAPRGYLP